MEVQHRRTAIVFARPGQQRFRFNVLREYGCKCAVCDIRHPQLIKAAHICSKSENGTDDWRNGVPLCATHHDAFDAYLFCIEPDSGRVRCRPGVPADDLGLCHDLVLTKLPHQDALNWRWQTTQREWRVERAP